MAGGIVQGQLSEEIKLGNSTKIEKTQAAHGFNLYEAIYHNGAQWQLAQADDGATLAEYVVTAVEDINSFVATKFGEVEAIGHGFITGEHYFLDDTTAGGAVITAPGGFSSPLFYVENANILHIEVYRPSTGGASTAPLVWEKKVMTSNNTSSQLDFTDLTIGKEYRVSGQARFEPGGAGYTINTISLTHDGNTLVTGATADSGGGTLSAPYASTVPFSEVFIATATSLTFSHSLTFATLISGASNTFATLEEMPTKTIIMGLPGVTKWQKKVMSISNTVSQMDWSNLTIGNTYRLSLATTHTGGNTSSQVQANHNGSIILETKHQLFLINPPDDTLARSTIFTAGATSVSFTKSGGGSIVGGTRETYSILEELPTHIETTEY